MSLRFAVRLLNNAKERARAALAEECLIYDEF
jgi:hypothetical protein